MNCPKCGAENAEDLQQCSACGDALANQSTETLPNAKTSGLAIVALVLGISSFFTYGITIIPAIIFGVIALIKIGKSSGRLKGRLFAIGGVVISIALLLAILLAGIAPPQVSTRLVCGTNVRGLVTAVAIYANDYDDDLPTADKWCDLLMAEADVDEKYFRCPEQPKGSFSYALNKNLASFKSVPADIVLIFEADGGRNAVGGPEMLTTERHKGEGCNVGFTNGYVEFVKTEDLGSLKWAAGEVK